MNKKLLFTLVLLSLSIISHAQSGTLDSSFNSFDIGLVNQGPNGIIQSTAIQPDGKIIIGGYFNNYNGTSINKIVRLNSDGSIDLTFNPGMGSNNSIKTILVQGDGKILIVGDFTLYNNIIRNRIARLNADGTLDLSFNPGTGANMGIFGAAIQGDGKIIVIGNFTSFNSSVKKYIARLNTNGTLDQSFSSGTGFDVSAMTVCIQTDGKLIVGGAFSTYNGVLVNRIVRLNTDGTLDTTFNTGTGTNDVIHASTVQSDEKVIIGGDFTTFNETLTNKIARLNANGTLDTSFNAGTSANYSVNTTSIQSNGKIIIGGGFTTSNESVRGGIVLLNSDGSLDADFNVGVGTDSNVISHSVQADGKIIIGGTFTSYNGTAKTRVARINGSTLDIPSIKKNTFVIYPNPVSAILNVESNESIDAILVHNLQGQLVLENKNSKQINVESLATGTYFVKINSGNLSQVKKFVKN